MITCGKPLSSSAQTSRSLTPRTLTTTATPAVAPLGKAAWTTSCTSACCRSHGFEGAVILHQLKELAPDRLDTAFTQVRDSAPAGYLH